MKTPSKTPPKTLISRNFLRSLIQITKHSASEQPCLRSRRIKCAAYSSMAFVVGKRRAWSRAILRRIPGRRGRGLVARKRVSWVKRSRRGVEKEGLNQADKLRKLVPGGKRMEFCDLLEETADYIKCLSAQVKLMKNIADKFSA